VIRSSRRPVVVAQAEHANPLYQAFTRARAAGRRLDESDYAPMAALPKPRLGGWKNSLR